ncbi:type II secretion system F family protein [Halosimplex halobium]|uniref:type II secretion system F family protein n=1 Tax=Halosimplex halobium TaxID=3396618 RepID=UPI003F57320B
MPGDSDDPTGSSDDDPRDGPDDPPTGDGEGDAGTGPDRDPDPDRPLDTGTDADGDTTETDADAEADDEWGVRHGAAGGDESDGDGTDERGTNERTAGDAADDGTGVGPDSPGAPAERDGAPAVEWDDTDGAAARNPEESFLGPTEATAGFESIDREDLREHYGPVRTFFKRRADEYGRFQRQLSRAWLRDTYDIYLTRLVHRMVLVVGVAVALAALAGVGVLVAGRLWGLPTLTGATGLSAPVLAGTVAGAVLAAGLLGAVLYWVWRRVYRIQTRIGRRRREINYNLPYAITFMYALSRAGVSFDRILVRLAEAEETYGAASQEFDRVVRDVEMFGNNLYIGLENLRTVTPSDELRRFTDDLMTVLESGGDVSAFLRDEVDEQLDAAVEAQESFVERLELLSEVFVVGFVAAPLFVLVVLIVVSFLGEDTLTAIKWLIYVAIPLALAGFVVLVDMVSQPFRSAPVEFTPGRERPDPPEPAEGDPEWREDYERTKLIRGLQARLLAQVGRVREEPERAFLFSVPVAVALPAAAVATGAVTASVAAVVEDPVTATTQLVVAPLVLATVPVAVGYEARVRQEAAFRRRFPDVLDLLATSNRRGLSLTAALAIVADSTTGRVGEQFERLRNDIRWNFDTAEAFEAFGDRISSPALTRTVKLIAEGSRATSDLHAVLDVAATDTTERVRLRRQRQQALQSYLAIVVIGFLVYLLVVLMLSANFLDPIETYAAEMPADIDPGPVNVAAIPVDQLRMVLFHSALIQGFGSGLLAGKLAEGSLYAGLKYGVGLVVVAVVAFMLI